MCLPFQVMIIWFTLVISGASTCEYILGHSSIWRVPEIISKNICISCQHAAHVYRSCGSSHGISWASKMNIVYRRSSIMIPYIVERKKTPRTLGWWRKMNILPSPTQFNYVSNYQWKGNAFFPQTQEHGFWIAFMKRITMGWVKEKLKWTIFLWNFCQDLVVSIYFH